MFNSKNQNGCYFILHPVFFRVQSSDANAYSDLKLPHHKNYDVVAAVVVIVMMMMMMPHKNPQYKDTNLHPRS